MKRPFVYLIRKRALGDVLWIEPVIRQLAARNRKVIVFTKSNELFENYPLSNVVFRDRLTFLEKILWKLESWLHTSFFVINLEMAYEMKPKMPLLHAFQEKAGLPLTEEYPRLYLSEQEKRRKIISEQKHVVLHLESFADKNYRKIYGIDWPVVVAFLQARGFTVVQIGKDPAPISGVQHVPTSIREMIVLLSKSSMFIGLDSGPSHLATSLGIPSIIFFGAVNPAFRHFQGILKGIILQSPCEFAGCYHEASNSMYGTVCRLVGDDGIPKCSVHTNETLIKAITQIISKYVDHEEDDTRR